MRNVLWVLGIAALCFEPATSASSRDGKHIIATGWFADEACAVARAKSGTFTPTNPECALRCVKKGAKLVFIAEQQKAIWSVARPDGYVEHIGEFLGIGGVLDDASSLMQNESIKTIEKVRPSDGLPQPGVGQNKKDG